MWYAVQTPTGREAEMAEKLNRVYSGESDKPCFVLSKERSWRMGGIYHIGVEPMFPGYIFVDTDDAGELEQKIGILAGSAKLPLDEKAVPLEKAEEDFLKRLLREDPQLCGADFLRAGRRHCGNADRQQGLCPAVALLPDAAGHERQPQH